MNPDLYQELVKQISSLQKQLDALVKPENGRWIDWTPTVTQNVAVTRTIVYARYCLFNGMVIASAKLDITSAGTAGNSIIIGGLPYSAVSNATLAIKGSGVVYDASVAAYNVAAGLANPTSLVFWGYNVSSMFGVSPNMALANGDFIGFTVAYETT